MRISFLRECPVPFLKKRVSLKVFLSASTNITLFLPKTKIGQMLKNSSQPLVLQLSFLFSDSFSVVDNADICVTNVILTDCATLLIIENDYRSTYRNLHSSVIEVRNLPLCQPY